MTFDSISGRSALPVSRPMSQSGDDEYSRRVAGESHQAPPEADELRRLVPVIALGAAVFAAVTDPLWTAELALAAIPVAAFGVWAYWRDIPLPLLAVAVIVPVVAAQRTGQLEPLFFEVSLLAFVTARWSSSLRTAVALGVGAALTPIAVSIVQDPSEIAVPIWIVGIAFPWVLGLSFARYAQLAAQLETAQRQLGEQALLAERRRIARDMHDFVGHGLAAVMLQVTSARHVLRRDPASAEEALRAAEALGRSSMDELRRTVGLLRSADEPGGVAPPLPSAGDVASLVEHAQAAGLAVELRTRGDLSRIPPTVGVAVYRIAQESLANAARHAPRARTVLELELADGQVHLVADTDGPAAVPAKQSERSRYGLVGMRERAVALGGELTAGPTPNGWRVSCRLPLNVNERSERHS
jgi:signal transduction histidine kinase